MALPGDTVNAFGLQSHPTTSRATIYIYTHTHTQVFMWAIWLQNAWYFFLVIGMMSTLFLAESDKAGNIYKLAMSFLKEFIEMWQDQWLNLYISWELEERAELKKELCESWIDHPGLPVPNRPYGHSGRKATLNECMREWLLLNTVSSWQVFIFEANMMTLGRRKKKLLLGQYTLNFGSLSVKEVKIRLNSFS